MLITLQPGANTNPDPVQGGSAVSSATNTGHGSTTVSQAGAGTSTKSCIWTAVGPGGGLVISAALKFDWDENGSVVVGTGSAGNSFRVQYSLDGGSVWNTAFNHTDVTSSTTSSTTVSLTLPQDFSQIQVRDRLQASATNDPSDSASITASISNIRVEVDLAQGAVGGLSAYNALINRNKTLPQSSLPTVGY